MGLTPDDYADLEWRFGGGAEADLGCRSIQGWFEATMNRLSKCEPASERDMHLRESRGGPSDVVGSERILDAAKRIARITARLEQLRPMQRRVLELQHGDSHRIHGLSLALLCQTRIAKRGFEIALGRSPGKLSTESIRSWVIWVSRRDEYREIWEQMFERVDRWTREAWKGYSDARMG